MLIEIISPHRQDVKRLIDEADALMLAIYPPESNHLDGVDELASPNVCFVGAFIDSQLAGIGAVKSMEDDGVYGEIKRVYVDPQFRGQRVSVEIMHYLEQYLVTNEIRVARLETGDKQTAAIGLYKKLGYHECTPYGHYVEDPNSVFMEKKL